MKTQLEESSARESRVTIWIKSQLNFKRSNAKMCEVSSLFPRTKTPCSISTEQRSWMPISIRLLTRTMPSRNQRNRKSSATCKIKRWRSTSNDNSTTWLKSKQSNAGWITREKSSKINSLLSNVIVLLKEDSLIENPTITITTLLLIRNPRKRNRKTNITLSPQNSPSIKGIHSFFHLFINLSLLFFGGI